MAAFDAESNSLQASGAKSVDKAKFAMFNGLAFSRNSDTVMGTIFVAGLSAYAEMLKANPNNVRTLADIQKFTEDDPRVDYLDRDMCLILLPLDIKIKT